MLISLESIIKKYNPNIKGVLHLGAHLLEEKSDYDRFNIKDVIWVEGNPNLYNIDIETLKNSPNHKIYNCIISDEDNVDVEFKITNNGQSSSILDLDKHKKYYPHIVIVDKFNGKTKTLKTLINENNIDITKYNFLNIDLQGVELRAIKGLGELLTNIDYIYTEVNCASVYKDNDLIDDIDSYLKQYGFLRKETHWSDAEWGDALYIKEIKTTQIVSHILPNEIDDLENTLHRLKECSLYLDPKDKVSIKISLNLSDQLVNWQECELKQDYFKNKFESLKQLTDWTYESIFEIIDDNSILGTTAQKREASKGNYNQFIFLDCDIAFHPFTLKYILDVGFELDGKYIVTPQIVKLWDSSWDHIVHNDYKNHPYEYEKQHDPDLTYNQNVEDISIYVNNPTKFGCGWFTLYSKEIMNFIGIPEFLGHYGSEDTFMSVAMEVAKQKKINVKQYVMKGIYVSENIVKRNDPYKDKIKLINLKDIFRAKSWENFHYEIEQFKNKL